MNPQKFISAPEHPAGGFERQACICIDPVGFHIRHPPVPDLLSSFITPDTHLFQTIHTGAAAIGIEKWKLVLDGLVSWPFTLSLEELFRFPKTTVTSIHECYSSPVEPVVENLWRLGNVEWSGVKLKTIIALVEPLPEAQFVWSEGLDYG